MCLYSINNWAQEIANLLNKKKIDATSNSLTMDKKSHPINMKIKYYHVEEIVPMRFGGHKTVYEVSNEKLIQKYDLGPNNKRIITPVYEEVPPGKNITLKSDSIVKIENTKLSISDEPKKTDTYAYINIIKTYERVAGKGYESVDILKMIANYYFFNNELVKAEKCYSKLFAKTSDLDPAFFFHYALALKAVGKIDKANEYFKKFHQLTNSDAK